VRTDAQLAWHEHWLLYSAGEGNLAAFDTDGVAPTVDLGVFARALPEAADGDGEGGLNIQASWAPA